jgi:hypothetical protein
LYDSDFLDTAKWQAHDAAKGCNGMMELVKNDQLQSMKSAERNV